MPPKIGVGSPPLGDGHLWEVAVALPLFTTLTYRLPPSLAPEARVGCLVRVPVGRRQTAGFLLGPAGKIPGIAIRDILEVLDPAPCFGPELVPLWRWAADYYQYPLGEALSHLVPGGPGSSGPRQERYIFPGPEAPTGRLGPRAREVLDYLGEKGAPVPVRELRRLFPAVGAVLQRLAKKGLVRWDKRPVPGEPPGEELPAAPGGEVALTPEQGEAVAAITQGLIRREFTPFLLHGVTASGKTEVYLAAAQEALSRGLQVLVLLPEIALTHPVALECRRRFGGRVALLHSGLSEKRRLAEWRRLAGGQADVVVGARSAVFAPLPRVGLIVVDE